MVMDMRESIIGPWRLRLLLDVLPASFSSTPKAMIIPCCRPETVFFKTGFSNPLETAGRTADHWHGSFERMAKEPTLSSDELPHENSSASE